MDLSQVEIVVLDEADEMLSMGFEKDVETLLSETPRERQTLLFSATLPKWARKLAKDHLTHPEHIDVMGEESISYEEVAIEAPLRARMGILSDLLHLHHGDKAIIFTHTKAEVDKLAKELSLNGHAAEAIHGDLNQTQRERVLGRFRSGQVNALIGTNVAARGLDIPEVDLVVHYRVETEMDAYQTPVRAAQVAQVAPVKLFCSTAPKSAARCKNSSVPYAALLSEARPQAPTPFKKPSSKACSATPSPKAKRIKPSGSTSLRTSSLKMTRIRWRVCLPSCWAAPPRRAAYSRGTKAGRL